MMNEVKKLLSAAPAEKRVLRFRIDGKLCMFVKRKITINGREIEGWHQTLQNELYGWFFAADLIIPSYMHLRNYRPRDFDEIRGAIAEHKYNGTNLQIAYLPELDYVLLRTRMAVAPDKFIVPSLSDKKLIQLRKKVLEEYSNAYHVDEGVVFLKMDFIRKLLKERYPRVLDPNYIRGYHLFFELYGFMNPIIIDKEAEFGMYDVPLDIVLIDVLRLDDYVFLSRDEREALATKLEVRCPEVIATVSNPSVVSQLKKYADEHKIEGFVLKKGGQRIKLKSDVVLSLARREQAIQKGIVLDEDIMAYIEKASGYTSASQLSHLVESVMHEAEADYPPEITARNYKYILVKTAEFLLVSKFLSRLSEFDNKGEAIRSFLRECLSVPELNPIITGKDKESKRLRNVLVREIVQYYERCRE